MALFPVVSAKQIQHLDHIAISKIGIPSLILMENAGRGAACEMIRAATKKSLSGVGIFCGPGNNGGDGFVTARYLIHGGIKTKVFLIGKAQGLKTDARINYKILKRLGCAIKEINNIRELTREIKSCSLIVDALFGVGLNRTIEEPFRGAINALNASKKRIISIDTPSGLDVTTGKIHGVAIKADRTITFTLAKKGFFKNDGPKHTGKITVVDIGIPRDLTKKI